MFLSLYIATLQCVSDLLLVWHGIMAHSLSEESTRVSLPVRISQSTTHCSTPKRISSHIVALRCHIQPFTDNIRLWMYLIHFSLIDVHSIVVYAILLSHFFFSQVITHSPIGNHTPQICQYSYQDIRVYLDSYHSRTIDWGKSLMYYVMTQGMTSSPASKALGRTLQILLLPQW